MAASPRVGSEDTGEARRVAAPVARGTWSEHLRPRSPYEATDFGFQFVRPYYGTLLAIAAAFLVPVVLVLAPFVNEHPFLTSLAIWWAKPVWERPILFHLSRAFFGQAPTARESLRGLERSVFRGLLASLTLQRLAPTRSFDLPVSVLEGGTGAVRSARLGILRRGRHGGAATALTLVLIQVEGLLQIGLASLLFVFLPESVTDSIGESLFGGAEAHWLTSLVLFGLWAVSILLVAPFYVAAGFSLYLHRRTELEAWDVELIFRRIAERASRRAGLAGAALAMIACVSLSLSPDPVAAYPNVSAEEAKASIETILEGEDFHEPDTVSMPRFLHEWEWETDDEPGDPPPQWLQDLLAAIATFVAEFGQVILIALGLGVVGWLVLRILREGGLRLDLPTPGARRKHVPGELFGLEITEESLPDDVAGEALGAARSGRPRDALALLYRGALSRLALVHGAELSRGVTERECLDVARPLLAAAAADYFARLTGTWLRCAYGHLDPTVDDLGALCEAWPRFFDTPDRRAPEEVVA